MHLYTLSVVKREVNPRGITLAAGVWIATTSFFAGLGLHALIVYS